MQPMLRESGVSHVSRDQSEELLSAAAHQTANPREGLFGPDSMSWKINRESALFLGAGRAAILQLAHPWVATALEQHSSLLSAPVARFHNTFRIVFTTIFGSLDQALGSARHLYQLHTRIRGELTEGAGAWRQGSHYEANELAALKWVYATLVESAVLAHECVLPPLNGGEREAYYSESRTLAGLFGIPRSALPDDWSGFIAYIEETLQSGVLGVTTSARRMAQNLLAGAGSWIHPPRWYRALTIAWLPARLREEFHLEFRGSDEVLAAQARRRLRWIYRRIPNAVRWVGPYHEARARLANRRPGPITRMSNRFWIGAAVLPFGGNEPA